MNPLRILIASMQPDLVTDVVAQGLFAEIRNRTDVVLLCGRVLAASEVAGTLAPVDASAPCALIVVGDGGWAGVALPPWLDERPALVVTHVALDANAVRVDAQDVGIAALLSAISMLAGRHRGSVEESEPPAPAPAPRLGAVVPAAVSPRPLLPAALAWVHALVSQAVVARQQAGDELPGLVVSHTALQFILDSEEPACAGRLDAVNRAEASLMEALDAANPEDEPLAALHRRLGLDLLEWKVVLLALAPELDLRYQKCFGFLLDDMGQRAGTLALFAALLGDAPAVRRRLAQAGRLAQWRLLGSEAIASDQALRVDPCIVDWLLGRYDALGQDARLRHALRPLPWPGAQLLRRPLDGAAAMRMRDGLRDSPRAHWLVLPGNDLAGWRALLELGAQTQKLSLQRCELARLAGADRATIEDIGVRLARRARLAGHTVVIDAAPGQQPADADALRLLLSALAAAGQGGAIVAPDPAWVLGVLDAERVTMGHRAEPDATARGAALVTAAHGLGLALEIEEATAMGAAFPLAVDGLALAARLARARARPGAGAVQVRQLLSDALRDTVAYDTPALVNRIVPRFRLSDVVVSAERGAQLREVVDNVKLAHRVLDDWGFAARLPYGRGVTVLFHGASGTGKTMAAQGIASELGIDLFAIDISRVVSKYIGETEKNIDAVFSAAQRAGAAVLIDEADALFGKRSEVKDAHDRYANIEVAYLLQRMETFDGLAILTTNLRQNLDTAFLRRLRFVIEFPRPDATARESIWTQCLPAVSHRLSADELRLLARKVELTGGHIRQVTLRAAFAAAAEGRNVKIGIGHIGHALGAELAKLGLPPVQLEAVGKAA